MDGSEALSSGSLCFGRRYRRVAVQCTSIYPCPVDVRVLLRRPSTHSSPRGPRKPKTRADLGQEAKRSIPHYLCSRKGARGCEGCPDGAGMTACLDDVVRGRRERSCWAGVHDLGVAACALWVLSARRGITPPGMWSWRLQACSKGRNWLGCQKRASSMTKMTKSDEALVVALEAPMLVRVRQASLLQSANNVTLPTF
jgi:hypothetical protein